MCDRILLFSSNPGRVAAEIKVELPHPRNRLDPTFRKLVDSIYARMTQRSGPRSASIEGIQGTGVGMVLNHVSSNLLSGLIETLARDPYHGHADLPVLAESLQWRMRDELFHLGEALQLLRFAQLREGDLTLTDAGTRFANLETGRPQKTIRGTFGKLRATGRPDPPRARRTALAHRAQGLDSGSNLKTTCPRAPRTKRSERSCRGPATLKSSLTTRSLSPSAFRIEIGMTGDLGGACSRFNLCFPCVLYHNGPGGLFSFGPIPDIRSTGSTPVHPPPRPWAVRGEAARPASISPASHARTIWA